MKSGWHRLGIPSHAWRSSSLPTTSDSREAEPETEAERILLEELDEQTTLAARLLVLLVRFLFASFVLTAGLILLSSGLGTRRLLAILDSTLEQQERGR